jgi:hypothetical protein
MNKCLQCTKETLNQKFCSRSCAAKFNNAKYPKRKLEYNFQCKSCGSSIARERTYCKKCWTEKRTILQKMGGQIGGKIMAERFSKIPKRIKHCLQCDSIAKNKFCSSECSIKYKFLKRVKEVESCGYLYDNTKHNTSAPFCKRYLAYKYGNKCSICGQEPIWNNKKLTLIQDHINGIPNDWSIPNLRLVCPNCDSQLSTYKGGNKGHGRISFYKTIKK